MVDSSPGRGEEIRRGKGEGEGEGESTNLDIFLCLSTHKKSGVHQNCTFLFLCFVF